jgi:hypothetical protein
MEDGSPAYNVCDFLIRFIYQPKDDRMGSKHVKVKVKLKVKVSL